MRVPGAALLLAFAGACAHPSPAEEGEADTETGTGDGACEPLADSAWSECDGQLACVTEVTDLGNPGAWIRRPLVGSFHGTPGLDAVYSAEGGEKLELVKDVFGERTTSSIDLDGWTYHDASARVRIDDDDLDDVVVVTAAPSNLLLFTGSPGSGLEPYATLPVTFQGMPAGVAVAGATLDGDSELDYVVVGLSASGLEVLAWRSSVGDFTASTVPSLPYPVDGRASRVLAVADFDGDGDADLALPTVGGTQVLRGQGDASFEDWAVLPAPEHYSLAVTTLESTTFLLAATADALLVSRFENGEWTSDQLAFAWASCPSDAVGPEAPAVRWPGQVVARGEQVLVLQDENPLLGEARQPALALHHVQLASGGPPTLVASEPLSWVYGGCCAFDWLVDPGAGSMYVQVLDDEHHEIAGLLDLDL